MKTIMPSQIENTARKWYLLDANGKTLGRLATTIAVILKGKNKVSYAPHLDNGDYVVVLNADKIKVTGKKLTDKIYYKHTGFLGGIKSTPLKDLLVKKPTKALEFAVAGMLPKNRLRRGMMIRLKLVDGETHTFAAQKPELLNI